MSKIELCRRVKYAGDVHRALLDLGWELDAATAFVEALPDADVEPVRRGKWEGTADGYADGQLVYDIWNCSECGFDADGAEEEPQWKFCPNCGAKMDGGAEDA